MAQATNGSTDDRPPSTEGGKILNLLVRCLSLNLSSKDREQLEQKIREANKLCILVTGRHSVGKSTIFSGLMGKKLSFHDENSTVLSLEESLQQANTKVTERILEEKGIKITVVNLPCLRDGFARGNVEEAKQKIETAGGLDLILYCKKMGTTDPNSENEKKIIKELTDGLGKLKDSRDKEIGKDIWNRCLFTLSFANEYEDDLNQRCHQNKVEVNDQFKKKVDEWRKYFKKSLNDNRIYIRVNVSVAGYKKQRLIVSDSWLSDFWAAAVETSPRNGTFALLKLAHHRIAANLALIDYREILNPENHQIVLTDRAKKVFRDRIAGLGIAVVAGAVAGAAVGATIGAVCIGIISFGPAAGAGLVIGGAVGAAVGSAIGGTVVKARERHMETRFAQRDEGNQEHH